MELKPESTALPIILDDDESIRHFSFYRGELIDFDSFDLSSEVTFLLHLALWLKNEWIWFFERIESLDNQYSDNTRIVSDICAIR